MNTAIPWMRFSPRTREPQACLQARPSNLHSPSVLLISRLWTRRHSNFTQLLQISHFAPPLWQTLVFFPQRSFPPRVTFLFVFSSSSTLPFSLPSLSSSSSTQSEVLICVVRNEAQATARG